MTATAAPTALTEAWSLIGATGYQYLVEIHDGSVFVAFTSSAPGTTIKGHAIETGAVITPPTGMALYGRSMGGPAHVTVTQGNAG